MVRRDFLKFLGIASLIPAIGRAELLSQRHSCNNVRLGEFPVAGFQYHEGMSPQVSSQLTADGKLLVQRDSANPYDPCALKILTPDQQMLGFLPRNQNRAAASLADQSVKLSATVAAFHPEAEPWERLTVVLYAELPNSLQ